MPVFVQPHTPLEQDEIVERAVRFIEQARRESEYGFAVEVGRHLFENLFRKDVRLFATTSAWKTDSIKRIASDRRVHRTEGELSACVKTYLLTLQYRRTGRADPPPLSRWVWARMWDLHDDPETLMKLVEWACRRNAPRHLVEAVVQTVHPYVAAGGELSDLLVDPDLVYGDDTPYRRTRRILAITRARLESGPPVPRDTRDQLVDLLARIERALQA